MKYFDTRINDPYYRQSSTRLSINLRSCSNTVRFQSDTQHNRLFAPYTNPRPPTRKQKINILWRYTFVHHGFVNQIIWIALYSIECGIALLSKSFFKLIYCKNKWTCDLMHSKLCIHSHARKNDDEDEWAEKM